MSNLELIKRTFIFFHSYEPLKQVFSSNLTHFREEQGLSKESLGLMSGMSRQFISGVEHNHHDLSLSSVQHIADGLCMEPFELLIPRPDTFDVEASLRLIHLDRGIEGNRPPTTPP